MEIINIALIQLRTSVQLYNKHNFISAITLAAAAEEILGQIAKKKSQTNALLDEKVFIDQIADLFNKDRPQLKKVINSRNKIKNQVKHNDIGENIEINYDFKFEAETFILGAIRNHELIFGQIPNDKTIISFWDHISL